MSILSNHYPEILEELNRRDDFEPPAAWQGYAEYQAQQAIKPRLEGLRQLVTMLEGLAADAERNQHVHARGPASRHEYRGCAIAYRNSLNWLKAEVQKLEG